LTPPTADGISAETEKQPGTQDIGWGGGGQDPHTDR
jgi:hypothetical protein